MKPLHIHKTLLSFACLRIPLHICAQLSGLHFQLLPIVITNNLHQQLCMQSFDQENDGGTFNMPNTHKSMLRLASLRAQVPVSTRLQQTNTLTSVSKFNPPRHRTQQTSPVYAKQLKPSKNRLPQLLIGEGVQQRRMWAGLESNSVSKTTHILDSLIKILKDDDSFNGFEPPRKRAFTESQQFREEKSERRKKPKIVKNQVTRLLFEENDGRKLLTEDRCRKPQLLKMDYTFYGGNKTLHLKGDCPFDSKEELERVRQSKLTTKISK